MPKIKSLNPLPQWDIGGADLFVPFRHGERIGYLLGDSFGGDRPRVGGEHWRSPILLWSDRHDLSAPIRFIGAARSGGQLLDYVHTGGNFTKLPADAISIDGRLYLWVLCTFGLGNESHSELWTSDDDGESWTTDDHPWMASDHDGKRVMISWERGGDGYVYIVSTGGLTRNKNLLLWRAPEDRLTDPSGWQPWGATPGGWAWGNPPSDILPAGTRCGEVNLRRIDGRWVLAYFDAGAYCAVVKIADHVTDNWHTAPTYQPIRGAYWVNGGPDIVPRCYGMYVHPDSHLDGPFVMIVSEWASAGEPYRASQFLVTLGARPNPAADLLARLRSMIGR